MRVVLVGKFQLQIENVEEKALQKAFDPAASIEVPVSIINIPHEYYSEGNLQWNLNTLLSSSVNWKRDEFVRILSQEIDYMIKGIARDLATGLLSSEELELALVEKVTTHVALAINRQERRRRNS